MILSVPLAFVLSVEWSFENGLIENAQIVVLFSAMIFILIRFVPVKKILSARQPLTVFAEMILAIIFSFVGEHHLFLNKACGQILEELNELIFYTNLPAVALQYCRAVV